MKSSKTFLLGCTLLLGGCATVPPEQGFNDVAQQIAPRLDQKIHWRRGTAADAEVDARINALARGELSADAAVQIALLNNHGLQAGYETLGIAQADLVQAGLLANPVFGASVRHGSAGLNTEFSVTEDFLNVLTRAARQRAGAQSFEQARLRVSQNILDLAAEVRTGWYRAVADGQRVELLRQSRETAALAAELAQRQYRVGNLSKLQSDQQQHAAQQAELEFTQAELQRHASAEDLRRLLALVDSKAEWTLPASLPALPGPVAATPELERQALAQRFDLAAEHKAVTLAQNQLDTAQRYRYLSVLGIGVSTERDVDGSRVTGPKLEIGLPVFDAGKARIDQNVALQRRADQQVAALTQDVRTQVRQAASQLQTARASALRYRDELLPIQQQIVAETQLHYNGMLIGVYDLLQSKQNALAAERAYVNAQRDYWVARTALEHAIGARLPLTVPAPTARKPAALEASPRQPMPMNMPMDMPMSGHQHGAQ